MFKKLTDFTQRFANHPHTEWWLFFYAVIESMFFPIPPDVLLIALALTRNRGAQRFAFIAAVGSVVGGVGGYCIGRFAFEPVAAPVLNYLCDYSGALCPDVFLPRVQTLFAEKGIWVIAISAMSAVIPYKLTILAAGVAHMPIIPFIAMSLAIHWFRYAAVSWAVATYGQRAVHYAKHHLPWFFTGVGVLALVVLLLSYYL